LLASCGADPAAKVAADAEDTLRFAELTGVRPIIEKYPLTKAGEAYARMISGKAEFRVVLTNLVVSSFRPTYRMEPYSDFACGKCTPIRGVFRSDVSVRPRVLAAGICGLPSAVNRFLGEVWVNERVSGLNVR
jgi:D-arabinose 1-dehydrogenase-like Zn-dependent alcohol dehydrogenase